MHACIYKVKVDPMQGLYIPAGYLMRENVEEEGKVLRLCGRPSTKEMKAAMDKIKHTLSNKQLMEAEKIQALTK